MTKLVNTIMALFIEVIFNVRKTYFVVSEHYHQRPKLKQKDKYFWLFNELFFHFFPSPPKPVLLTSRYQKAANTNGKVAPARSSLSP